MFFKRQILEYKLLSIGQLSSWKKCYKSLRYNDIKRKTWSFINVQTFQKPYYCNIFIIKIALLTTIHTRIIISHPSDIFRLMGLFFVLELLQYLKYVTSPVKLFFPSLKIIFSQYIKTLNFTNSILLFFWIWIKTFLWLIYIFIHVFKEICR